MSPRSLGTSEAKSLTVWGTAIVGKRSAQEDSYRVEWLAGLNAWLLILCDGMGGHAAGAIAGQLATEFFRDAFQKEVDAGRRNIRDALGIALAAANTGIRAHQEASPETRGMGTTLVAAIVTERDISWISVGDSPLWLYRAGGLERLNDDHSLRGVEGKITLSRNILQSAVTGGDISLIDAPKKSVRLSRGDAVILASDGILTLDEGEIARIVTGNIAGGAADTVKALLNAVESFAHPEQDNCSIIVLRRAATAGSFRDRIQHWFSSVR